MVSEPGRAVIDLTAVVAHQVPLALAQAHQSFASGAQVSILLDAGRRADGVTNELVSDVVEGAGFELLELAEVGPEPSQLQVTAERRWSLADYVGPDMKLLICGLNPSPGSADAGVGFHRAGNRFWPAAIGAGLVAVDRDPRRALLEHGVGMTDIVKRPTRRASELDRAEYKAGLDRVTRLVEWLKPQAICMVGLAGWRAAVDRKAPRGWQQQGLGGRPVYLMPSTSGLNAHDTLETLTAHLISASRDRHTGSANSAGR